MRSFTVASVVLALASAASADVVHADIWVAAEGGTLVTRGWDHLSGTVLNPSQRVFEAEFGVDPSFPFATDEPGVGSNLGVGTSLTMRLQQGLGSWNGGGFDPVSGVLGVAFGPQLATSTTGGSVSATVTTDFHWHPDYFIEGPNGADAPDGIYLAAFDFAATGFASSETLWVVFNLGMTEADHETAVAWVESNLVPTPGATVLLGAAGLRRRRRRS